MHLPNFSNVKLIYRSNEGFDFGAWGQVLISMNNRTMYKYFVFANTSSRGPILIPNFHDIYQSHWLEIFTSYLTDDIDDHDVHLVGPTINCENPHHSHVQSYFMVATPQAVELGIANGKFQVSQSEIIPYEMAVNHEVGFSQLLVENGMNIATLMREYQDFDFRTGKPQNFITHNPTIVHLNPVEMVMIKLSGYHKSESCVKGNCKWEIVDDLSEKIEKEVEWKRSQKFIFPVFRDRVDQ